MRFHVVSLAHTETTGDYPACAYTQKTARFCTMMRSLGHDVFLYAGERNDADVTEHVVCITRAEQAELCQPDDHFQPGGHEWALMNFRATEAIRERAEPHDFLCLTAGLCQQPVALALPALIAVEVGVGYGGVFADYRVFESYAWMHTVYGATMGAHTADGRFYDTVIPNFFDVDQFPYSADKDDYLLFVGRLIDRKGPHVAAAVAERLGLPLILAGEGEWSGYGTHVGVVGPEERGRLMSRARALLAPTLYVEPFGGVAVEAMLCGTPVISSDFGAFTETVLQGVSGWRCRTFGEFCQAARDAPLLDPATIREQAVARFSTDVVRHAYDAYFRRLLTLWGDGWWSDTPTDDGATLGVLTAPSLNRS